MLDMHVHLTGHGDRLPTAKYIREFLDQAQRAGLKQIGFADHDVYYKALDLPLIRKVAEEYPDLQVAIGLEVDYRIEDEGKIKNLLEQFPFDFVIGSVHEINGWAFDYPEEEANHHLQDPDKMYGDYFDLVAKAAASNLFTTIGHFDLIKIFGVRPKTDVLLLAAEALACIQEQGLVVELNTAGGYKPVGEYYPEAKLLKEIIRKKIPMTLGSDAHRAVDVGRDLVSAAQGLKNLGVKELVGFKSRKKEYYPL